MDHLYSFNVEQSMALDHCFRALGALLQNLYNPNGTANFLARSLAVGHTTCMLYSYTLMTGKNHCTTPRSESEPPFSTFKRMKLKQE